MVDEQAPSPAPVKTPSGSEPPLAPQPVVGATVSAHFKMIFLSVFSLTAALIIVRVTVAIMVANPSDALKDAMSTCNQLGNAGFGAMLGLIGGKVN